MADFLNTVWLPATILTERNEPYIGVKGMQVIARKSVFINGLVG